MKEYQKIILRKCHDINEVYLKISEVNSRDYDISANSEGDEIKVDIRSRIKGISGINGTIRKAESDGFLFVYTRTKSIFDILPKYIIVIGLIAAFLQIIFFNDAVNFFFYLFAALFASAAFYSLANMSIVKTEKFIEENL